MTFADHALARRIERAEALNARDCVPAREDGAVLEAGGGFAVFAGSDSPLTHAIGMGMNGCVSIAELERIENFFRQRGASASFDLSPLADTGVFIYLSARGYRVAEFNNVLVRRLAGFEISLTPRVRRALPDEQDLWAHALGHGFFEKAELTDAEMNIGRDLFQMPGALCYLTVGGSQIAGGGAMAMRDGLATLCADATIAAFRGSGLHRELIAARLNEAVAQGADMATASTLPGSQSQRNYERLGFEVIYTRVTLTL